jgi:hypothetical protein
MQKFGLAGTDTTAHIISCLDSIVGSANGRASSAVIRAGQLLSSSQSEH